jgi:malonyl-CoA O-methyltransferase
LAALTLTKLDQRAARRSFDRAAANYDASAVLQREVESRLFERLEHFSERSALAPEMILDLGCGTGHGSSALARRFPEANLLALDWSFGMLEQWRARPALATEGRFALHADMHRLPLAPRSVDLVFSNLALQWSADQDRVFDEVRRVLRAGGLFVFSSFGPDTLHELRSAWSSVDDGPHVNRFIDMHDVGDALVRTGFRDPVLDSELLLLTYADPLALMRELKAFGARNSARGRASGLTGRGALRGVLAAYEDFRRDDRYPATYELVFGVARGPDEGQPVRGRDGEVATFSVDSLRARR